MILFILISCTRLNPYRGNGRFRRPLLNLSWQFDVFDEIPVVVTKVGYWPSGHSAHRVRKAQQTFCDSDLMAACVSMNDTSRFYHYDATSFLIGGHRIAKAYLGLKLTQPNLVCPQSSMEPSWSPTKLPTPDISSQDLISGISPKSAGALNENGWFKHVISAIILILAVQ